MQNYKSFVTVMICATLVNTHTHTPQPSDLNISSLSTVAINFL